MWRAWIGERGGRRGKPAADAGTGGQAARGTRPMARKKNPVDRESTNGGGVKWRQCRRLRWPI